MSAGLIKQLESAVKRQRSGGKKKSKRKAKRKSSKRRAPRAPKIVYRTRVKTVVRHVHHRPTAHAPRRKASKKRKAKKGGKPSKNEFLRRMALGRARAKRARNR